MPRIKRWFPVNHNINRDPEIWVMRREIGEKSLSIWLEFLSLADQNEGELRGDYQELIRSVSGTCQATVRTVTAVYQYAISKVWLSSEPTLHVVKYWNYHKPREPQKNLLGSLPSDPSEPSDPNKDKEKIREEKNKRAQAPLVAIPDWVPLDAWNGFVDHRKKIRKPLTQRAIALTINQLLALQAAGNDPAAVLDQSVSNGWTGIFPLKNGGQDGQGIDRSEPKGFASVRGFLANTRAR